MRWLMALTAVFVAVPAFAQENDAEKLFRAMEKKLRGAKTVQFDLEVALDIAGKADKLTGKVALAEGDKASIEAEGAIFGMAFKGTLVSNGTKVATKDSMKEGVETKDTPKKFNDRLLTGLARGGLFAAMEGATKEGDAEDLFKVSDFKLGAKEKVGGRDTQAVEFTSSPKTGAKGAVTVWIDTQTNLPAKVSMKAGEAGFTIQAVETYANLTLDGKVDPKRFELPK